jgi:hypothetical protein
VARAASDFIEVNWRLKCFCFRALSAAPGGGAVYANLQKYITRSTSITSERLAGKTNVALDYWQWLSNHGLAETMHAGRHIDFGAGWHPAVPLTFYSLGISNQILLDISPVMSPKSVADSIRVFRDIGPALAARRGLDLCRLPPQSSEDAGDTKAQLAAIGATYQAPYVTKHLREAQLNAALVTSTQTLYHIDKEDLTQCLLTIFAMLKPGGLFLGTIHLKPLYMGLARATNDLDHLRYSPEEWARFSSRLMNYTRLKAPDYHSLLSQSGFDIAAFDVTPGPAEDLRRLDNSQVHPCFSHLSPEDLVARHLFFAARRPNSIPV